MNEKKMVIFNTNVFKKVKLAMGEDEIKVEEERVKELGTYLKDVAIQNLIKNL